MPQDHKRLVYLFYVLAATTGVYLLAHFPALSNGYVINDDVRQQIYWMQYWNDPDLFQNDLLSRYARSYVPWGVQAVYALASPFVNPVQFSKVVAGILFVVTAGFLFGLGLRFKDNLTGVLVVCVYFLFGVFLHRMSGGMSRGFVYPLMAGYLFFLACNRLTAAGVVILLLSLFNPYGFLVCLFTHALFVLHTSGKPAIRTVFEVVSARRQTSKGGDESLPASVADSRCAIRATVRAIGAGLPVGIGLVVIVLQYAVFKSPEFGKIVAWADMIGKVEYSDAGRYGIVPVPSIFFEIIRPWVPGVPHGVWGVVIGCAVFLLMLLVSGWALTRRNKVVDLSGFRVFAYLLVASAILYALAHVLLMRLFLPARYMEYSLNIFCCLLTGVCLRIAIEELGLRRYAFPLVTTVLVVIGAGRLYGVGLDDYSGNKGLYKFLETKPKTILIAGHPDLMDNVVTFARRKAFVTYELSHTWYLNYWDLIKKRTLDFFRAYYSPDPEQVRRFCRDNGIDYLIVREEDFARERPKNKPIYFEPFDSFIRDLIASTSSFAVLDRTEFPPVYQEEGIRVIKPH